MIVFDDASIEYKIPDYHIKPIDSNNENETITIATNNIEITTCDLSTTQLRGI